MTFRDELQTIGFALAAMGVAFGGTIAALLTMIPFGFYPFADLTLGLLWAAVLPAVAVGLFTLSLARHPRARLHPVPVTAAAFVGGLLSFSLFHPFGVTSIMFLPALLVYPVTLLAGFFGERLSLDAGEVALHAVASLALYAVFAVPQLAIVLRWVDLTGCDGCDPDSALLAAAILFVLALTVVVGAALRHRPSRPRTARPSLLGTSGR